MTRGAELWCKGGGGLLLVRRVWCQRYEMVACEINWGCVHGCTLALLYNVVCPAEFVRVCPHDSCTLFSNRWATQRTSKQAFNTAPPKAKFNPDMQRGRWATVYQQWLDPCRKGQGRTTNIWQPFAHPKAHKSSPHANVCFAGGECLHSSHCFHWGHHRRQKSVVLASSLSAHHHTVEDVSMMSVLLHTHNAPHW